jgi:hypothetical protein
MNELVSMDGEPVQPWMLREITASAGSIELAVVLLREGIRNLSDEQALEIATTQMGILIGTAPRALQGDTALTCAYHNLRSISARASNRGDLASQLKAQTEINKLLAAAQ